MTRAGGVAMMLVGTAALGGCSPGPLPTSPACNRLPDVPLQGRLTDAGAMLDARADERVVQALAAYHARTGRQLVVVTVKTLEGLRVEQYAQCLGDRWGIGEARRNDGVVILLARDEAQVRIATGRGAEALLTDAEATSVIGAMTPYFRTHDFERGLAVGIAQIAGEMGRAPDGGAR